jgi:hypothetical protein
VWSGKLRNSVAATTVVCKKLELHILADVGQIVYGVRANIREDVSDNIKRNA